MVNPLLWQDLPFGNLDAWATFLRDHAALHTALWLKTVVATKPQYDAHPLADGGGATWLWANQMEHVGAARRWGISEPPDLASYDLNEADQFADWMQSHAADHARLNNIAGIV